METPRDENYQMENPVCSKRKYREEGSPSEEKPKTDSGYDGESKEQNAESLFGDHTQKTKHRKEETESKTESETLSEVITYV